MKCSRLEIDFKIKIKSYLNDYILNFKWHKEIALLIFRESGWLPKNLRAKKKKRKRTRDRELQKRVQLIGGNQIS